LADVNVSEVVDVARGVHERVGGAEGAIPRIALDPLRTVHPTFGLAQEVVGLVLIALLVLAGIVLATPLGHLDPDVELVEVGDLVGASNRKSCTCRCIPASI